MGIDSTMCEMIQSLLCDGGWQGLDAGTKQAFASHVAECSLCRLASAESRRLGESVQQLPVPPIPPALVARLGVLATQRARAPGEQPREPIGARLARLFGHLADKVEADAALRRAVTLGAIASLAAASLGLVVVSLGNRRHEDRPVVAASPWPEETAPVIVATPRATPPARPSARPAARPAARSGPARAVELASWGQPARCHRSGPSGALLIQHGEDIALVSAAGDGVRVWDARTTAALHTLPRTDAPCVASPELIELPQEHAIAAFFDGRLRWIDTATWTWTSDAPTGTFRCPVRAIDGTLLAVQPEADRLRVVRLSRAAPPVTVATVAAHGSPPVALAPDGRSLAIGGREYQVVDLARGEVTWTARDRPLSWTDVRWSRAAHPQLFYLTTSGDLFTRDGTGDPRLLRRQVASFLLMRSGNQALVRLREKPPFWNPPDGSPVWRPEPSEVEFFDLDAPDRDAAFGPDGTPEPERPRWTQSLPPDDRPLDWAYGVLATRTPDGVYRFRTFSYNALNALADDDATGPVQDILPSRDGKSLFVTGTQRCAVIDRQGGEVASRTDVCDWRTRMHPAVIRMSLTRTADGRTFVVGNDTSRDGMRVPGAWEATGGFWDLKPVPAGSIGALSVTTWTYGWKLARDAAQQVEVVRWPDDVEVRDLATNQRTRVAIRSSTPAFEDALSSDLESSWSIADDGRWLALSLPTRDVIWDLRSGQERLVFPHAALSNPRLTLVAPDGRRLLRAEADRIAVRELDGASWTLSLPGGVIGADPGWCTPPENAIRFLSDRELAVLTRDGHLQVWDLARRKQRSDVVLPEVGCCLCPLIEDGGRSMLVGDVRGVVHQVEIPARED